MNISRRRFVEAGILGSAAAVRPLSVPGADVPQSGREQ